jgi:hypothetical protein
MSITNIYGLHLFRPIRNILFSCVKKMKPSLMLKLVVYIVTAGIKMTKTNCGLVTNIQYMRTVTRRRGKARVSE